jgi:hypothetical protein
MLFLLFQQALNILDGKQQQPEQETNRLRDSWWHIRAAQGMHLRHNRIGVMGIIDSKLSFLKHPSWSVPIGTLRPLFNVFVKI